MSQDTADFKTRVVRADRALKCCEENSGIGSNTQQIASVQRLLDDLTTWIAEIRNEFEETPTDTDGNPAEFDPSDGFVKRLADRQRLRYDQMMVFGFVERGPQTGKILFPPTTEVIIPPAGGGVSEIPSGTPVQAPKGPEIAKPSNVPSWAALGVLTTAIGADLYYTWAARRAVSGTLRLMEVEVQRQRDRLRDLKLSERDTADCEDCIRAALLPQDNPQKREYGKHRTRI